MSENQTSQTIEENDPRESQLNKRIIREKLFVFGFNIIAWIVLLLGIGFVIYWGHWAIYIKEMSPEQLGSFIGGTAGVYFSFTAMLFVYLAFRKQNQQLLHQQLEILLTRKEQRLMTKALNDQEEEMKGQRVALEKQLGVFEAQKKAMESQVKLLEKQQKAMENQRQEMEEQNQTIAQQRFENTFFQMLGYFREELKRIHDNPMTTHFPWFSHFKSLYQPSIEEYKIDIDKAITKVFNNDNPDIKYLEIFNTFYQNLINILELIDKHQTQTKSSDIHLYIDILKSQLLTNEILILFYSGTTGLGIQFKKFAEKYHFFKNINENNLIYTSDKDLYNSSAFREIINQTE